MSSPRTEGLSSQVRADYTHLIDNYLDNITIQNVNEFETARDALKTLGNPANSQAQLTDRVKTIKEFLDKPELFVKESKHINEFKSIVMQRVASKIEEFDALDISEKEQYIADHKKMQAPQRTTSEAEFQQLPILNNLDVKEFAAQIREFPNYTADVDAERIVEVMRRVDEGKMGEMLGVGPGQDFADLSTDALIRLSKLPADYIKDINNS